MPRRLAIRWDGKHLPAALKKAPPGTYALQPIREEDVLTPAEERGLMRALDPLDAGQGKSLGEVLELLRKHAVRS